MEPGFHREIQDASLGRQSRVSRQNTLGFSNRAKWRSEKLTRRSALKKPLTRGNVVIDGAPTEFENLEYRGPWQFWQRRFYDFNVRTRRKSIEKLKYIHRNPVVRELVSRPEDWRWSSFRHYAMGEIGPVEIESDWTALRREREVHVMEMPSS